MIGSYMFVLMMDWFLIGSGVQQMVLNSIRKSAIAGFTGAYVTVPYQTAGHCFVGYFMLNFCQVVAGHGCAVLSE